ncbi:MAG TPA: TrkA family potassium uptake protein [Flavobacteriales bacterium]|nr:TrkA family potassium uptake protein [Flavobacteriales bacterium]HIA11145.1 TrkA family potassium uptake protein [Flavobacteriales bacterium]
MRQQRFTVIGLGLFGTEIAKTLAKRGAEVLAIDLNDEKIKNIQDEVAYVVSLDATDIKALQAQNINNSDAVVVAIGENFESLLLCTVHLLDLKVKRIIARARGPLQRMILKKLGVTEILSPEIEVGTVVAEQLIHPSIGSFLQLPDEYEIAEVKTPRGIANRSLEDIKLRDKYKLNIITVERETEFQKEGETVKEKHILGIPRSTTMLYETDTIIVFGRTKDIKKFIEINQ